MSESLRDQLLKAGFAAKPKVEARSEKNSRRPPPPKHPHPKSQTAPQKKPSVNAEPDLAHAYAMRAKQEKTEREQAQRDAERQARENRERKQKLANLLNGKALNSDSADVPRHFPHGNKIRRIYCMSEQLGQLNRGELAVVQLAGRYLLVTREVALQAQAINPPALVLLCDPHAPSEDDVPVDLMW